jgi:transcriptional regulator with XRE-family HTH domain
MAMSDKTKFVKEKTGMTLKELASQIGYSNKHIVESLRGKCQMSYSLAKVLAEKTGASPIYFMENQDDHE